MTPERLKQIQKLSASIENFKDCYKDCELWSRPPDGNVHVDDLMTWLIENPHMGKIAAEIKKLDS